MRLPLRLLAVPASVALTAVIVGTAVAPSEGGDHVVVPRTADLRSSVGAASADSCSGGAAADLAAQRDRGVSYDFLMGRTFKGKATAVGSRAIVLDAGLYPLYDFTAGAAKQDSGRVGRASAGLIGAGSSETTLELEPDSSSRASAVPKVEYQVNPLNVLRVSSARAVVGGFTLAGTDQGHTYNGLRLERSTDARVTDVHVTGIRGDMDRPPGETFGINDFKTTGSRYSHIEVDGSGVGAAGFAANGSKDITVCASSSHDNPVSMGFAFWSVEDITLIDCTAKDNGFTGFNFERVSGDVVLKNPVAEGNRWDMRVVSDLGSAKYTIIDPDLSRTQVPGTWTVEVPSTYWHRPSLQKRSDITLIVDGKERPDLLRFVAPY